MSARERAQHTLNHYIGLLMERNNLHADYDTQYEINQIVDDIIAASVEAVEKAIKTGIRPVGCDYKETPQKEETCAGCGQPRVHPFHAPKGLFGSSMATHEFKER